MTGAELIAQERARQIEQEGYTPDHDRAHASQDLTHAGIAYAITSTRPIDIVTIDDARLEWWPWKDQDWKPSGDRIRDLVRAGALLAAAIDRAQAEAA